MSQPQGTEGVVTAPVTTPEGTGQEPPQQQPDNGNPAWASILDVLPESLHSQIKPELLKWDQGVQKLVEKTRSEYEPYKPLIENQIDPNIALQGVQLLQLLEENPAQIYKALLENYPELAKPAEGTPAAATTPVTPPEDEEPWQAEIRTLKEQLGQVVGVFNQQQQQTQAQQNQAQLQTYLSGLAEKYKTDFPVLPDGRSTFPVDYVIANLANGKDGEVALQEFKTAVEVAAKGIVAPNLSAPDVIGAGGSVPSTQVDITKLDDKATKDLVVQLLEKAKSQTG